MKTFFKKILINFSLLLLKILPLQILLIIGKFISIIFYNFGIKSKKIVKENLKCTNIKFSIKIYFNFADSIIETLFLLFHDPDIKKFCFHNLNLVEELKNKGEKISFISIHYGNWDVVGQILQSKGCDLAVVYQKRDEWFYKYFDVVRTKYGIKLFDKNAPLSFYLEQIEKGKILVFLIDQKINNTKLKKVKFIGIMQLLPYGWYKIVERFNLHPVIVLTRRVGKKHHVYFFDAEKLTYEGIYNFFEKQIKKDPFQYDFFSKIFQDNGF